MFYKIYDSFYYIKSYLKENLTYYYNTLNSRVNVFYYMYIHDPDTNVYKLNI